MCSPDFKRFLICRINTEVNERVPGAGTLEPEPQAASTSILPSLVPRVLRAAWQQSKMTSTSPPARYNAGWIGNQSSAGPPSSFLTHSALA